jgi:hypothetical protein
MSSGKAYRCLVQLSARHPFYGEAGNGTPRAGDGFAFVPIGETEKQLRNHRILVRPNKDPIGLMLAYPSSSAKADKPIIPPTSLDLWFAVVVQRPALLNIVSGLPAKPERLGRKLRYVEVGPGVDVDEHVVPTSGRVLETLKMPVQKLIASICAERTDEPLRTWELLNPETDTDPETGEYKHVERIIEFTTRVGNIDAPLSDGIYTLRRSIPDSNEPLPAVRYYKGAVPPGALAIVRYRTSAAIDQLTYAREINLDLVEAKINVNYCVSIRKHTGAPLDLSAGTFSLKEGDAARGLATPNVTRVANPPADSVLLSFTLLAVPLRAAPFRNFELRYQPPKKNDTDTPKTVTIIEHLPGLPLEHYKPIVHVNI